MDDQLALTSDLNVHGSMRRHLDVLEQFYDLKNGTEMLMEENMELKNELASFQRKERHLESVLTKIKTEVHQVNIQRIRDSHRANTERSVHHEITSLLNDFLKENVQLKEKVRRQGELLGQANREASESATHHQKTVTELMAKLNTLKMRKETLCDDQCAAEWRKLRQALDVWTRKCFKDRAALDKMTPQSLREGNLPAIPSEEVLQNVHAKRAYVQSVITTTIFGDLLQPDFVLSPTANTADFLNTLSEEVKNSSNNQVWEHWRLATSKGLDIIDFYDSHRLIEASDNLYMKVDYLISKYCDPNSKANTARETLPKFLEDCVAFKKKLERQESEYKFRRSEKGALYSSEHMSSLNFKNDDGSTVQISVWPSICKVSFDNETLLIEPEFVWTEPPSDIDEVDIIKLFAIKSEPE